MLDISSSPRRSAAARWLVGVPLFFAAALRPAGAGQIKIVDLEYSHDGWYRHIDFLEQPDDWTAPHDYHKGYTYIRFEVVSFEGDVRKIGLHNCYFQDRRSADKHACNEMQVITETGAYYRRNRNSELWQVDVIDWSRRLLNFMQIDNAVKGEGKAKVRITVFIVPDGCRFAPPYDWDCPAGWDCGPSAGEVLKLTSNERIKAAVRAGDLGAAWVLAEKDAGSGDPEKAESGRRAVGELEKYADQRRAHIEKTKPADPASAVDGLVELAREFGRCPRGRELMKEAARWEKEPATRAERQARGACDMIRKQAEKLRRKLKDKKASDPEAMRKYGRDIIAIARHVALLKKRLPDAPSTARAVRIAERLGIPLE